MEGRPDVLVRQAFEHQADHAQVDPGFAGNGQEFVVLAHSTVAPDPGKRPLHDPTMGRRVETWQPDQRFLVHPHPAAAPAWPLDDLQAPAEGLTGLGV